MKSRPGTLVGETAIDHVSATENEYTPKLLFPIRRNPQGLRAPIDALGATPRKASIKKA